MTSRSKIPIAIVIGGIIIAGTIYLTAPEKSPANPSLMRPISAADHILGNPAAKVMIVEYSDFECPYCAQFHTTLHQIVANEGAKGEVAWVFRHFPLVELEAHKNALQLAKAAECAGEAGGPEAFWRFADALYERQPATPSQVGTIAASVHIPGDTFATCYASESAAKPLVERIMQDRQNALDMGADGTPFSIIVAPGKSPIVIESAYSYGAVQELVDEALSQ